MLTDRELAAILAGLRAQQNVQQHEALAPELDDIATNGGTFEALDDREIDVLCERLNATHDLLPSEDLANAMLRRQWSAGR